MSDAPVFDTKIAVVLRDDLAVWQKTNVTAFLVSGIAGTEPADVLVLEDAPAGVEAGLAAGMTVVAVLTTNGEASLRAAHARIPDLRALLAEPCKDASRMETQPVDDLVDRLPLRAKCDPDEVEVLC